MTTGLDSEEVQVRYVLTDQVTDVEVSEAFRILSVDERHCAERFRFARDRLAYVVAHGLLRCTLSAFVDIPPEAWAFNKSAHGKPALAVQSFAPNLSFNLAHTDGLVACVVSRQGSVGVDVECLDRRVEVLKLARRYFSATEARALEGCAEADRHVRFFDLWTLKEAYVKGLGTGLSHPLSTFSFVLDVPASIRFEPPHETEASMWRFALFSSGERHRLAVAAQCGSACRMMSYSTAPGAVRAVALRRSWS